MEKKIDKYGHLTKEEMQGVMYGGSPQLSIIDSGVSMFKTVPVSSGLRKGSRDRRIIRRIVKDGREYYLHATKGWKSRHL